MACVIYWLIFQENWQFDIYSSDYSWATGLALPLAARALNNADFKGAGNFSRRARPHLLLSAGSISPQVFSLTSNADSGNKQPFSNSFTLLYQFSQFVYFYPTLLT